MTKSNKLYLVEKMQGISYGPVKVSSYFPRIRGQVDAVYTTKRNNREETIFFKGNK